MWEASTDCVRKKKFSTLEMKSFLRVDLMMTFDQSPSKLRSNRTAREIQKYFKKWILIMFWMRSESLVGTKKLNTICFVCQCSLVQQIVYHMFSPRVTNIIGNRSNFPLLSIYKRIIILAAVWYRSANHQKVPATTQIGFHTLCQENFNSMALTKLTIVSASNRT